MSEFARYPPPQAPPLSPPARPVPPLAGWWWRVLATLVDTVISFAIAAPLAIGLGIAVLVATGSWDASDEEIDDVFSLVWIPIWIAWLLIYYPLTMRRGGSHNGQTLGKQVARIRVIREDGYPVTAQTAILREVLVKNLLFATLGACAFLIPYLLDFLWPLWDDRNQALHDKMASTLVVSTRGVAVPPPAVPYGP